MDGKIHYLNTDLDIVSEKDLTQLDAAMRAGRVEPLHVTHCDDGLWRAIFETKELCIDEPEKSIAIMLTAIESFDTKTRRIWSQCELREFNIGYDCGDEPWEFNQGLSSKLIARIARSGASLRITLYPDREPTIIPSKRKPAKSKPVRSKPSRSKVPKSKSKKSRK